MVTRHRMIAPEIAAEYQVSLHTVTKNWMQDPTWPGATGRREKYLEFDRGKVAEWVAQNVLADTTKPIHQRDPQELITRAEIAEESGLSIHTITTDLSRGRLVPRRGHTTDDYGNPLWRRGEIAAQLAARHRRRSRKK